MHRVTALVRSPQATFELGCAATVFRTSKRGPASRYAFGVGTEHPGPVSTNTGCDLLVTDDPGAFERADTVIIPGWLSIDEGTVGRSGAGLAVGAPARRAAGQHL